jgi:O-antigen/teichoic acid export membrane protein
MHANIGEIDANKAAEHAAGPAPSRRERLISIPYLLLRASTAGGALAMGFVQTFVFARVLAPEQFSIFIVVGAIGYTLWFTDLGLAKILFVNLRAPHLAGRQDEHVARQATAVIAFYVALAVAASLVCFPIAYFRTGVTAREAADFALFLLYITLNLGWFSLRTLSIAVDFFVPFERLELVRRTVNIASLLSMLAGVPLTVFLVGSDLLWAALFAVATTRLVQRGALIPSLRDAPRDLVAFFRSNWHAVSRSSAGALSGLFVATFPYYFVSLMYGLGSAPIILEVTFRIFRGTCVIFAAICDLAIPGQTRALAARDRGRLIKTTLLAAGLCCVPAIIGSALLIFAGGPLFKFILHTAATVPPGVAPVLVVLLLTSVVQIVAEALLQYSGFFRSLALNGIGVVIGMIAVSAIAAGLRWDIVAFLAAYSVVYAAGAAWLGIAAIFGPVRAASGPPAPSAAAAAAEPTPV